MNERKCLLIFGIFFLSYFVAFVMNYQKEVISAFPCTACKESRVRQPGAIVDFAIGLVNSVLNLPDGQVKIFRRIKITEVL